MDVVQSRFPTAQCPNRGCSVQVVEARERGIRLPFEVQARPDGTHQLRDTGGDAPVATRLTVGQKFGKLSYLHRKHDCPRARRR